MAKKAVTLTIDGTALIKGKKRAVEEHRNFSNYVEWLIIRDFKRGEKNKYDN